MALRHHRQNFKDISVLVLRRQTEFFGATRLIDVFLHVFKWRFEMPIYKFEGKKYRANTCLYINKAKNQQRNSVFHLPHEYRNDSAR
jgi:Zn-dependent peptidase ImmA (M78 family)